MRARSCPRLVLATVEREQCSDRVVQLGTAQALERERWVLIMLSSRAASTRPRWRVFHREALGASAFTCGQSGALLVDKLCARAAHGLGR